MNYKKVANGNVWMIPDNITKILDERGG